MPTATIEKAQKIQADYQSDPIYCSKSWFRSRLWSKQEKVMLAIRDYSRVAVKSGNTVGKSRIAGELTLTHLLSYYPSKVIITAPTFTQVEEIIWKEIAKLYNSSAQPIGGELLKTELKLNEEWFAMGLSTNEVNRFQGFHSPYLLVIIDEALGVAPEIWEAIEGLHPFRILALGNPLAPEGDFYNCFSSPLWHKITITCQECVDWQNEHGAIPGLVTQAWIDERKEEWGVKSPLYQARVDAEFPQEGTDILIPLKWVEQAREKEIMEEDDALKVESCDVARSGNNKTVVISRRGHTFYDIVAKEKTLVTTTAQLVRERNQDHRADSIAIDDDGVGGGVTDILTAQRIGIWAFHGGWQEKAIDITHYKNLRSQFYWIVAKKFEKGLYSLKKLPQKEYEILKNQLCSIKVLPPDVRGRIRIETKEDMLARGMKSPDYADAFMMSEYGFYMGKMGDLCPYRYKVGTSPYLAGVR